MKRSIRTFMALLALPVLAGLLQFGWFASPPQTAAGGGSTVWPEVWDEIQANFQADVLISLQPPDQPLDDLTLDEFGQNIADRQANILADLTPAGFTPAHQYAFFPALAGSLTASGAAVLDNHPDVASVALDFKVYGELEESVSLIHADQVHTVPITGAGINVAVLDTGIDTDHPDLQDSIIGQACFLPLAECGPPENPAEDDSGHGTLVSGVITSDGDNGIASTGVAPGAGIFAYKVLNASAEADFSAVADALTDVIRTGVNPPDAFEFVSMAFTDRRSYAPGQCPVQQYPAVPDWLEVLKQFVGTVAIAATGNGANKAGIGFPACIAQEVVAVGGVYDEDLGTTVHESCTETAAPDKAICASNSSNDLDLLAPGFRIRSTALGGTAAEASGTSLASAHAVGVGALMLAARPDLNPTLAERPYKDDVVDALVERMKLSGTPVVDQFNDANPSTFRTRPRIDARVALLIEDAADFDGDGLSNGAELNGVASPKPALGTLFANPLLADSDQDGCTDGRELGVSQGQGGRRDPGDFWDFFSVPAGSSLVRDLAVSAPDIAALVARFGSTDATPGPFNQFSDPLSTPNPAVLPSGQRQNYHPVYDRSGSVLGANPWNLKPPNGNIGAQEISNMVAQFGHVCA